ncbi:KLHL2 [Symbiodinium sp. CCMP2592]|nr:KLHL2 [Symbiodinium sp. CCMP2592]
MVEGKVDHNCYAHVTAYVRDVVSTISRQEGRRTKIEVDQSVIDRWEAIRSMTATHNVTFDAADGPVTAHDIALMATSPVLSAMLQSCMTEGAGKRIQVKDSSASGVSLFLDLVYTSSTCSEVEYKTALEAMDLAHRWQVEGVVRVLEEILQGMITDSNFVDIASAATLKGLIGLEKACTKFAQSSEALRKMSQNGELPPALEKLIGHPATASDTSAPNKKRRTF